MTTVAFSEIWWVVLIVCLGAYAIGNVNFAVILSKVRGKDIRSLGSGNPGTMNMLRNYGLKMGMITFLLDVLKGVIPTMVLFLICLGKQSPSGVMWQDILPYIAGVSCVLGHNFPVATGFKGGKGIASTLGMFLFMHPIVGAITVLGVLLYIILAEYGSVGSLVAVSFLSLYIMIETAVRYRGMFCIELLVLDLVLILSVAMTFWLHRTNIRRLIYGTENRVQIRKMLRQIFAKKEPRK